MFLHVKKNAVFKFLKVLNFFSCDPRTAKDNFSLSLKFTILGENSRFSILKEGGIRVARPGPILTEPDRAPGGPARKPTRVLKMASFSRNEDFLN